MKKCPYCSEEIQDTAAKCRYCGEWLDKKNQSLLSSQDSTIPQKISNYEDSLKQNKAGGISKWVYTIVLVAGSFLFLLIMNTVMGPGRILNMITGAVVFGVGGGLYYSFKKRFQPKEIKPQEISNYEDSLKQNKASGISKWVYAIAISAITIALILIVLSLFDREARNKATMTETHEALDALTAEGWVNKANALSNTDPNKAIEYLTNAIKLQPDYAKAYSVRGLVYDKKLNQSQQAIKDYSEAIRLQPDKAFAPYYLRGLTYTNLGQYQQAINDNSEAIRLMPDYAEAYHSRGFAYTKIGQYQSAIKDYNEAILRKTDYIDAYNNRGATYFLLKNDELGCADAQKTCTLGDCKLLEMSKREGYCR
jgi:tetratricopeptide (TPR) repeat protein